MSIGISMVERLNFLWHRVYDTRHLLTEEAYGEYKQILRNLAHANNIPVSDPELLRDHAS